MIFASAESSREQIVSRKGKRKWQTNVTFFVIEVNFVLETWKRFGADILGAVYVL
jgi:hypothetical protein